MSRPTFSELPDEALMRLKQILELIPVTEGQWYHLIREGVIPQGTKLGSSIRGWPVGLIRQILRGGVYSAKDWQPAQHQPAQST